MPQQKPGKELLRWTTVHLRADFLGDGDCTLNHLLNAEILLPDWGKWGKTRADNKVKKKCISEDFQMKALRQINHSWQQNGTATMDWIWIQLYIWNNGKQKSNLSGNGMNWAVLSCSHAQMCPISCMARTKIQSCKHRNTEANLYVYSLMGG